MPTRVDCSDQTVDQLRRYAQQLVSLVDLYKELTDSYVVEFFVKDRWELLPASWRDALHSLVPEDLSRLLLDKKPPEKLPSVWPLSLLSYRAATHALALDPAPAPGSETSIAHNPTFKPIDLLCRLHVKAKKRHEILRMAEVINSANKLTTSDRVVDVGSGQGHLSRLLSFGYGLEVTSVEAVGCHLTGAAKVDLKIKTIIQKRIAKQSSDSENHLPHTPPQHVECTVHPHITVEEFVNVISSQSGQVMEHLGHSILEEGGDTGLSNEGHHNSKLSECWTALVNANHSGKPPQDKGGRNVTVNGINGGRNSYGGKMDTFVLAGLHTCGDLAPTMLRVFARCPQAKALTSVACCYMKMECAIPPTPSKNMEISNHPVLNCSIQDNSARSKVHPSRHSEDMCGTEQTQEHQCGTEQRNKSNIVDESDGRTSCDMSNDVGYPMSQWLKDLGGKGLQFEALELACHSIHSYNQRLKAKDPSLIVHGYRCALEVLIQEADRDMTQNHAGVCRIKKAVASIRKPHLKSFEEYATTALTSLGLPCEEHRLSEHKEKFLPRSNNVIAFHVLRSLLGPIIESLVLVDRVLFLYEQGIESKLVPVFDATISPRNFALVAVKR